MLTHQQILKELKDLLKTMLKTNIYDTSSVKHAIFLMEREFCEK